MPMVLLMLQMEELQSKKTMMTFGSVMNKNISYGILKLIFPMDSLGIRHLKANFIVQSVQ